MYILLQIKEEGEGIVRKLEYPTCSSVYKDLSNACAIIPAHSASALLRDGFYLSTCRGLPCRRCVEGVLGVDEMLAPSWARWELKLRGLRLSTKSQGWNFLLGKSLGSEWCFDTTVEH